MTRTIRILSVALLLAPGLPSAPPVMSVCELSRDYPGWRNKVVSVRGVYFYGLRQDCPQKCADGLWPSFIDLTAGNWNELNDAEVRAEMAAKAGKHPEVWVTVVGRLQTSVRRSHLGPCDKKSWHLPGYGHLGGFPAQITVDRFVEIELRDNPQSLYDYANMYRGPM